jgi:low temperature requirement protein LtrA
MKRKVKQHMILILPIDLLELGMLFAVTALILLLTSELLTPYHRRVNMFISRKKLRRVAAIFAVLFLVTVAARILSMLYY